MAEFSPFAPVLCVETLQLPQKKYHRLKVQEKKPLLDVYAAAILFSQIGHKIIFFGIILMKLIFQTEFVQNEQ